MGETGFENRGPEVTVSKLDGGVDRAAVEAGTKKGLSDLKMDIEKTQEPGGFFDQIAARVDAGITRFFGGDAAAETVVASASGVDKQVVLGGPIEESSPANGGALGLQSGPRTLENPESRESSGHGNYEASLKSLALRFGVELTGKPERDFFNVSVHLAKEEERKSGIPWKVTLAQAMLESGHGQSGLTQNYLNCFGMKAGSKYRGPVASMKTPEGKAGEKTEVAQFKAYSSLEQSFEDHSRLLNGPRYRRAFGSATPREFIKALGKAGYYTLDPETYAARADNLLRGYGLSLD